MRLRQFLSVLGLVALIAVIYSPSTIGLSASPGGDGGTAPTDTSASGTSMFLAYLQQEGYNVTVETHAAQMQGILQEHPRIVYMLIGADMQLNSLEVKTITTFYDQGDFSLLIAEGNTTNTDLISSIGATATGAPIVDPTSIFQNKEVFPASMKLGSTTASGVIDIASPLLLSGGLYPVASSSPYSYDLQNSTVGPRTVAAAGQSPNGSHALVISDSGPFTNYLFNYTSGSINEKAFVQAMLDYVDPGKSIPIVLDASQYVAAPKPPSSSVKEGLPIGPLVAYSIEQSLTQLNSFYASFPSEVSSFLGGFGLHVSPGFATALVAVIILLSVYGAVTRWFAPEKRARDDTAQPNVERTIVAESRERLDFLATSRSKGGYVATLAQLYELLDSIVLEEFGRGISSIRESDLAPRVGVDEAARAKRLFASLTKFHDYATGETKYLFPPVFRWRALTSKTTHEAGAFLRSLGVTISGKEAPGKRAERMRTGAPRA